jgi:hypothetical protein
MSTVLVYLNLAIFILQHYSRLTFSIVHNRTIGLEREVSLLSKERTNIIMLHKDLLV